MLQLKAELCLLIREQFYAARKYEMKISVGKECKKNC
jgi:hypothetical protein